MNGRQTTFFLGRKLEVILRRGGAFVDWHCAGETRFASWEFPTGKSMPHWTTSRFAPHRTEVIHYERGGRNSYDGSFVELRTAFARKYLASPNFPVLRQALQPAPCGSGLGAIAMALQEFTQSLRRVVIPAYGG